jgi:UDP-GlcNAc:undecaprenyl-phosphate GlcNAc-1-phosphate transferase
LIYKSLASALIALATSMALVPAVRWLSFRTNHISIPREGRWHHKPTPTLGGVGIYGAFIVALIATLIIFDDSAIFVQRWSILVGITIMFGIGLIDDLIHISPPVKIVFQILAATMVIFFGNNTIDFFRWPIANIFLTFFWLIGITNSINLLDNMDGLAGGVALIVSCFLSFFFWKSGNVELLIISLSIVGSVLGFLFFNFPPAKIFMGDSGSMMLGFTLASLAIARRTQASSIFAIIGVPTLIFLLPILDTGLVTITRLLRGQSPAIGGTDHTSHRLIAFGLSERQAVLVLYGIALISGLASIGLEAWDYDLSLVMIPILLILLSLFVAYLARMKVVTKNLQETTGITQWLVNITFKRRIFELLFDFLLIGTSYYLAYWTRFGLNMTAASMELFLRSWPLLMGISYGSFYLFGIYKGMWRYIGINDLQRYIAASIIGAGLSFLLLNIIYTDLQFTFDVFLLFGVYVLIGLAGSRTSFQVLDRIYSQQFKGIQKVNVLLYGAEDAGEIALRWILRNPSIGYNVVGFVDDDPLKWGSNIHNVSILGDVQNIERFIEEKQVNGVIAISESILETPIGEILKATCKMNGLWLRVLRLEFELSE